MTTDRDLDTRLTAAAGIADADLPALPAEFLEAIRADADAGQAAPAEPASVVAARQLASDAAAAHAGTRRRRRHPVRRPLVRAGAVALVAAAAVTTLVLVDGSDGNRPPSADPGSSTAPSPAVPLDPPGGLKLVAAEQVTFPYSLDPAPAGLTPEFSMYGGTESFGQTTPVAYSLGYGSGSDSGFGFTIYPADRNAPTPSEPPDPYERIVQEQSTVSVHGIPAHYVRGLPAMICGPDVETPTGFAQVCEDGVRTLTWQLSDGSWVRLSGSPRRYGTAEAFAAAAETLVDRPQPVQLQIGLAPEGYQVAEYSTFPDTGALTLARATDPSNPDAQIRVTLLGKLDENTDPVDIARGGTLTRMDQPVTPVDSVTIQGKPAVLGYLVVGESSPAAAQDDVDLHAWHMVAQFPDGTSFYLEAPETLSRDDVMAMANSITHTP